MAERADRVGAGAGVPAAPVLPQRASGGVLSRERIFAGWGIGVGAVPLLTVVFSVVREHVALSTVLLSFLLVVVAAAAVGGIGPGLVTALGASLAGNWFFTPPLYTHTIREPEDAVALGVFVVVAAVVSTLVTLAERRSLVAARARAETAAVARAAVTAALRDDPLPELLEHVRAAFQLDAVTLLVHDDGWLQEAHAGPDLAGRRDVTRVPIADDLALGLAGRTLGAEDLQLLRAFAGQLLVSRRSRALRAQAGVAERLSAVDALRTAILAAVSHDLRTPLASIKAAVTSLLQSDVDWSATDRDELLQTIDEETDRLNGLVGNLLDMSRLQTGALAPIVLPVGVDEVVDRALAGTARREIPVVVRVDETLPRISVDPALLERAVANVVDNARAWSAANRPVHVVASRVDGHVALRVVDHGPGIPEGERERALQPFQRLSDAEVRRSGGVGLGLAVAKGFVEAMGGAFSLEDTPGGGLTVLMCLPVADAGSEVS